MNGVFRGSTLSFPIGGFRFGRLVAIAVHATRGADVEGPINSFLRMIASQSVSVRFLLAEEIGDNRLGKSTSSQSLNGRFHSGNQ